MSNSKKDANRIHTLIGVDKVDAVTPRNVAVNSVTGAMVVEGSDTIDTTTLATSAKQDTQTTLLQGIAGFLPSVYDYISYTSGSTTDVYVFKNGGSGGTTVSTITITFTDSTKKVLSTVVKT